MGTRERRERARRGTRQNILTAAREIAAGEGWQGVTMRKVAELIEYSPPTIYEYFNSKDDILLALRTEGFEQFANYLRIAMESEADPRERLLKMGDAYWDFAMQNPELYQITHGLNGAPLHCAESVGSIEKAFEMAATALNEWARSQDFVLQEVDGLVDILRSCIHGLVTLYMVDDLYGGQERVRHLLRMALQSILDGWNMQKGFSQLPSKSIPKRLKD
jgi:AcrR family transcriptional regulator